MKKIFTLIAVAMMALGVNAQTWRPTETAPGAGVNLVDDDLLTASTVFATTVKKAEIGPEGEKEPVSFTINEQLYTFNYYMQLRVNAAPAAGSATGTEQSGSTPIVFVANKNVDVTVYYRRKQVNADCGENDGKDLKLVDQTKPTTALEASSFDWVTADKDNTNGYAVKLFKLEEGHTYTLWARGTTIQFYGFDYAEGQGADEVPLAADGTHIISFDGQSKANVLEFGGSLNGFKLQITGNEEKQYANASALTINSKNYTSMKVSNTAQNTLTLPEGKVASGIKFYSYVNGSMDEAKPCYWKEIAGVTFESPEQAGGLFTSYSDAENPDVIEYEFNGKANVITFTNTGIQCCFVIEITIETADASEVTEVTVKGGVNGIQTVKANTQNGAIFNLAGQKVADGFKGLVIKNGKKMVVK